jgi:Ca2+-binding EF-hand superfamily protein
MGVDSLVVWQAFQRLNSQLIEFRESFSVFDDENLGVADKEAMKRGMKVRNRPT